jgi:hypothetical protein
VWLLVPPMTPLSVHQDLGFLEEGFDRVAETDALDGRAEDVAGQIGALRPQGRLFGCHFPADIGALGTGDAYLGSPAECSDQLQVDGAPDFVGIAVGARNEIFIGAVDPVVADLLAGRAHPVRAARLADIDARITGAIIEKTLQGRGGDVEFDPALDHRRQAVGDFAPAFGGAVLDHLHAQVHHINTVDLGDAALEQRPLHCLEYQFVLVRERDDQQVIVFTDVA